MIHLRQPEERHGIQHFGQQHRTQHRADERATPTLQTRAAQHHGGDAGEGVIDALSGVADANLCHQHDGADCGEESAGDVTIDEGAVDRDAHAPCGFFVGADGAQAPAETGFAQGVFTAKGDEYQHDEGYRDGTPLPVDPLGDGKADVAIGVVAQQEAQALNADIHGQRCGDGGEVGVTDENAVDRPDNEGACEHQQETCDDHGGRFIIVDEEGCDDDEETGKRPHG